MSEVTLNEEEDAASVLLADDKHADNPIHHFIDRKSMFVGRRSTSNRRKSSQAYNKLLTLFITLFSKDLKGAETKEDILVMLTNVADRFDEQDKDGLDRDVRDGQADLLVQGINQRLLLRPHCSRSRKYYRKTLEDSQGLQVSVLCRALDMVLRCSDQALEECVPSLQDDLSLSLPALLDIFASWKGDSIVRLVTLASTMRIIRRFGPLVPQAATSLVRALLSLLDANFPSDIRVDAACAAVNFLETKDGRGGDSVVKMIEKDASTIISILSTAALAADDDSLGDILHSLSCMVTCPSLRTKLAKRRCAVLMVIKHLAHAYPEIRSKSLDLCHSFLGHHSTAAPARAVLECNMGLLLDALVTTASVESDQRLQLSQIRILNCLIIRDDITKEQKWKVMAALQTIALGDGADGPTMKAALSYLHSVNPMGFTEEALVATVTFATSDYAKVRNKALGLLKDISFWHPQVAQVLLETTDVLESFSLIISYGSDSDCADAIQVSKQLVSDGVNHQMFCIDTGYLTALVRLVTTEPIVNRPAYIGGVNTIITLMSSDDNLHYFLSFPEVLPWLVTFANRTCDDEIKQVVVSTIIRFSTTLIG